MFLTKIRNTFIYMGLLITTIVTLAQTNYVQAEPIKKNVVINEINQLITIVELSGCVFHRNASEYSSKDAAEHLRLKLRKGTRYANTTENFIDNLASESSWSGKPYFIECENRAITEDDSEVKTNKITTKKVKINGWLHNKLKVLRTQTNT